MTAGARLLVTGTRRMLTDHERRVFWSVMRDHAVMLAPTPADLTVVHGGCPTGIDAEAGLWAAWHGRLAPNHVAVDVVEADWYAPCDETCHHRPRTRQADGRSKCPAAGPKRNADMVAKGADLCLAFPHGASPGTRDCARRAQAAGIKTRVVELT